MPRKKNFLFSLLQTIARPIPNAEPQSYSRLPEEEREEFLCLPNLMHQAHLFSICGVGLSSAFYVQVTLALRELAIAWPFVSLRFVTNPPSPSPSTPTHFFFLAPSLLVVFLTVYLLLYIKNIVAVYSLLPNLSLSAQHIFNIKHFMP